MVTKCHSQCVTTTATASHPRICPQLTVANRTGAPSDHRTHQDRRSRARSWPGTGAQHPTWGPAMGKSTRRPVAPPRLARRRVFTSGLIGGRATPLVHLVPLPMWQERHPRSWPPSVRVSLPPQHFREPSGPTNVRTAAAACGRTAGWCSPFPCGSLATWSCWVRLLRSSTTEPGESSVRRLERPERRRGQRRQNRRPQSRPAPVAPADATTVRCPGESP